MQQELMYHAFIVIILNKKCKRAGKEIAATLILALKISHSINCLH